MSLDDNLKNYAKYQFEFEQANRMRKIHLKVLIIGVTATDTFCFYYFGL